MTPGDDTQKRTANIHVRCLPSEKEMLAEIIAHEHRTETEQVLHWVHREHAKLFGETR